ncbi:berbamunine synthase-like [Quercus lobata]|uniref:berbamunine synthase-like n=1 Tax=Quercus lobata TaxID=97700 RepID=UPI0012452E6A|nr:berbamunine synthase-like [Quercus lobata]
MIPDLSDFYPILTGMDFQGIQKKRDEIVKNFITIWDDIIKERRKQESSIFGQRDFLDALIKEGFTNDQISQLILDLLLAGTDSSSMVTEWAMAELMRNQDVLHKLRDELKREIGTEMVKESHLAHLPYLEACVKETLRLYPPGPLLIPHRALQTCQVMGYTIPKDSKILVNMWAIGRDPSIFNDSLRFNPERFLDSSLDFKGTNFAYTPFGAGRRVCPGQPLATKQVPLILASLVHSFDWFLPAKVLESQKHIREKKVRELVGFLGSKEGKGMGKEFRKFIGEMAELMITPDLSNLYPILGALDFQGKKICPGQPLAIKQVPFILALLVLEPAQ